MWKIILLVIWLLIGAIACFGQVREERLYDDLTMRVEWGYGSALVDSVDMVRLLELVRGLDDERDRCSDVVRRCEECDELIERSKLIVEHERSVWNKRVELEVGRGDMYKEWMQDARKGRIGNGWKWGGIGAVIGGCVGLVVGAVVW